MIPPIDSLPIGTRTMSPVFTLSGRLLAYTTSEAPRRPGPEGLGTIVTARSLRSQSPATSAHTRLQGQRSAESVSASSAQNAIFNSAVGLGGVAARGVWAGLKMGAQAAGRAANQRLATSAPARTSLDEEPIIDEAASAMASESRSFEEASIMDGGDTSSSPRASGDWVKIVDLCHPGSIPPRTIAHFRLPRIKAMISPSGNHGHGHGHTGQSGIISLIAFSPDGTKLFVAPRDGKAFHILDIHPAGPGLAGGEGEVVGEVWDMYELTRGSTVATVREVKWSLDERWIGVATQRGTVRESPRAEA